MTDRAIDIAFFLRPFHTDEAAFQFHTFTPPARKPPVPGRGPAVDLYRRLFSYQKLLEVTIQQTLQSNTVAGLVTSLL